MPEPARHVVSFSAIVAARRVGTGVLIEAMTVGLAGFTVGVAHPASITHNANPRRAALRFSLSNICAPPRSDLRIKQTRVVDAYIGAAICLGHPCKLDIDKVEASDPEQIPA